MILFVLAYLGGVLTIVSPLFFRCCRSCSLERTPRSSAVACHCLLAWLCDFCRGSSLAGSAVVGRCRRMT